MTRTHQLAPLSVVEYSSDAIVDLIRHLTQWHERGDLVDKDQIQYLNNYLTADHIKCQTLVIETEYIDRHYLEDYSAYYARCFTTHPRKCSRIHFFSSKFSEWELKDALNGSTSHESLELQERYIGFAVIRPIPNAAFARICLKPYDAIIEDPQRRIISKDVAISFFGIPLKLKTAQFIEQDKIVSACAIYHSTLK